MAIYKWNEIKKFIPTIIQFNQENSSPQMEKNLTQFEKQSSKYQQETTIAKLDFPKITLSSPFSGKIDHLKELTL